MLIIRLIVLRNIRKVKAVQKIVRDIFQIKLAYNKIEYVINSGNKKYLNVPNLYSKNEGKYNN